MRPPYADKREAAVTSRRRPGSRCWIGTSGWSYPHWQGRFYPEGTPTRGQLAYYAGLFKTVEINSSFYRLPSVETLRGWADHTTPGFVFACKASQYITHRKKLKDPSESLAPFLQRIAVLGEKLGPVLFQLPPRWRPNAARLEGFLEALPRGQRFTFEFRDPRWDSPEIIGLLERYCAALCCFDLDGTTSPLKVTADFVHIRLHGPGAPYQGSYAEACLADWTSRIGAWQRDGLDVYCYFDNDDHAYAPRNAQSLMEKLQKLRTDAAAVHPLRPGEG